MFKILIDTTEIQKAIEVFQNKIKNLAIKTEVQEWVFPSGGQASYETYTLNTPHCQNSCHPHLNNPNGEKGDNHGTIQCRTQTSYTEQTFIT